jgi:hypothetical protein
MSLFDQGMAWLTHGGPCSSCGHTQCAPGGIWQEERGFYEGRESTLFNQQWL